ncbi:hypothetical protein NEPAR06_1659 [Nematocida parisii]|uniref:Uncharacterized protein n=1 Tax=Nematocida parisii (strain ERTm3) TaxID=935791 RepID=I3EKJ5_NEMP3|nr:uncharacterized protein NEPG_00721 [Nematocida parisii ERTm1]EIJ89742.1 hypothetical protein NEQG_00512 [Nematocida parisii ERTm3]KAI5145406.1 hypothetical protein NEPAR07_1657 [Nematocida parisii]EIJ94055.1 hypothetical protein NEPG_00721 [Nematocida parisii ERTm1]KAI5155240.1 hypothetical protein NEPAR06_1659 [Nematocida parisii]KAI5157975.1 hypothetical protein NEPAR05_1752 [Nematocida parisii]|eukprot:XP_013058551.1 hypothetical protein NEPG_00721 [Nematocida parisii ERTm1]
MECIKTINYFSIKPHTKRYTEMTGTLPALDIGKEIIKIMQPVLNIYQKQYIFKLFIPTQFAHRVFFANSL